MMSKTDFLVLIVVLAGLGLRIAFVLNVPTAQMFDFATYYELALNIRNGLGHTLNGFPVAWQGPLYPYVLGIFFRLTNTDTEMAGKVLNIILSTLTMIISIPVYGRLLGRGGKQLAAVALMAFFPANIAYVNVLGTEVLFGFLFMAIICLFLYGQNWRTYLLLGLFTGLAALTRPLMLAFPAALCLVFWLRSANLKQTLAFTGIITAAVFLTVAPWTIRNYRHFDRFIPISYNAGYVQFINNNDHNHTGLWMDLLAAAEGLPQRDEIAAILAQTGDLKAAHNLEPILSAAAREWIFANPAEFMQLGFLRIYRTFFTAADDIPQWAMNEAEFAAPRSQNAAEAALNIILSAFSLLAFIFAFSRLPAFFKSLGVKNTANVPDMVFLVFFVFFAAIVFVSEGQARYAFPVYPLMIYAAIQFLNPEERRSK